MRLSHGKDRRKAAEYWSSGEHGRHYGHFARPARDKNGLGREGHAGRKIAWHTKSAADTPEGRTRSYTAMTHTHSKDRQSESIVQRQNTITKSADRTTSERIVDRQKSRQGQIVESYRRKATATHETVNGSHRFTKTTREFSKTKHSFSYNYNKEFSRGKIGGKLSVSVSGGSMFLKLFRKKIDSGLASSSKGAHGSAKPVSGA